MKVRLAKSKKEIRKAQRLRYKVFFEEGKAKGTFLQKILKQDYDVYDAYCDHLIVLDDKKVVGTYRLLPKKKAEIGFYSETEFKLFDDLKQENILEVGRACVHKNYRDKKVIMLLWKGIIEYAKNNNIDLLFGCVSFDLKDQKVFDTVVHSLKNNCYAHIAKPKDENLSFNILKTDIKSEPGKVPSLVKAYEKLGAKFSDCAVIDRVFNTVDVLVVLNLKELNTIHKEKIIKTVP